MASSKLTRSLVGALRVQSRSIVGAVEELDELAVAHRALLVGELHGLGMVGCAGADLPVGFGMSAVVFC